MSDELERKVSDDEETQEDDVEAHKKPTASAQTDDGDDSDDVEAHRKHGSGA